MLPEAVVIDGRPVRINSDFRMGVAIETELLSDQPDILGLFKAFYPDGCPENVEEAANQMLGFYAHSDREEPGEKGEGENGGIKRWYDFSQDADALMASFQQAYHIDLDTVRIHWWKFRRLMFGLPVDTPFMQRVHYRTADITKLAKEERKRYRKMKRVYALQQPEIKKRITAKQREETMKERLQRRFKEAQNASKD